MAHVRGIAEIVLNVRDIAAMERFYADVLGFEPVQRGDDPSPTIVFLRITDIDRPLGLAHPQVLALIDPARHPPAKSKFDPPNRRSSTLNHLAFEIDEAEHDLEIARLASLGIETTLVRFPGMRAKAIFFRDPEDNTVELICHDSEAGCVDTG